MNDPISLDKLFTNKIFRIPDYQRGYAWREEQCAAFWEDLINLADKRSHYTGVLTLKEVPTDEISDKDNEYWLIEDHSYRLYHIVDGQQRLTTFVIVLQALIDFVKTIPENKKKSDSDIYITDSLSVAEITRRYFFKVKPTGDQFRTYKFGYTADNPSYNFLRYRILGENNGGTVHETFYTLNLANAKTFFLGQIKALYEKEKMDGLHKIFKKLTQRFMLNEYIIKDDFDVFVAFETMNNRGKKLSDLELLKNRLIYLSTLYSDSELDPASRKSLRDTINDAWKEIYHQLGRNKKHPLNDDDFLKAHWTMYFKYSRYTGSDYINFLLDEQFTPKKIHKKVATKVALIKTEEQSSLIDTIDFDDIEISANEDAPSQDTTLSAELDPTIIRDYVNSLKESSVHWFNSFYPEMVEHISKDERLWIERLNRVGMTYFRPLIMAILKNEPNKSQRIWIFKRIERFIFILFKMSTSKSNTGSSEFLNAARGIDRKEITLEELDIKMSSRMSWLFETDDAGITTFKYEDFYYNIEKKFQNGSGYYNWIGLRHFLYEYELSLFANSRQQKVNWDSLLRSEKDKVSIEHIYPQTETPEWAKVFKGVSKKCKPSHSASLGNLLLLSQSINSSLQNDPFADKRIPKYDGDIKIRCGYSDGSHSEIQVAENESWGPDEIKERGMTLLRFMEQRWDFKFKDDDERQELLFLDFKMDV